MYLWIDIFHSYGTVILIEGNLFEMGKRVIFKLIVFTLSIKISYFYFFYFSRFFIGISLRI